MKRFVSLVVPTTLMLFLTACPQAVTQPPEQPVTPTPNPTTFPVTAVSGTIPDWTGPAAYLTLALNYEASAPIGGEEEISLAPPLYTSTLSATGAFAVPLGVPAVSELVALTCEGTAYPLGLLSTAVVSSTPQPAQLAEVLGVYDLGPPTSVQNAAWFYSETALELNATCTLPNSGPAATKLNLVPGWNQVIVTYGEGARLESGAIPASFVWSQF